MNIADLQVKNYGKFKDFECKFTPGLNVIKGGNETGKSTLVKAITNLLYSDPHSYSKEDIIQVKSWGSDSPPILKANIESNEFSGTIEKDFGSGEAKLANSGLNVTIDDHNRIAEILTGAIGFSTEELFEATSCIKQGEISHIDGSIKAIKDKLESMVTGSKEEQAASQIITRIERRIDDISRKDKINPGLIQKLDSSQAEVDYNLEKLGRDINNIKAWRNSLIQVEVAYANLVEDYENKKKKLAAASNALVAREALEKLNVEKKETYTSIEKVKDAGRKMAELESQLRNSADIPENDRKEADELESTLKYLKPKFRELESDVETEQETCDSYKIGGLPIVLIILSLAAIGFAVADYFMMFTQYFYEIGGGGFGLFLISLFILSRKIARKSLLKEQLKGKTKKLESVKDEINQVSGRLNELLTRYRIMSAEQARQVAWKRGEIENQLRAEKRIYDQYLNGGSLEELEIKLQNTEKQILDASKVARESDIPDEGEIERLKLIVGQLEEQKNNLQKELKTLDRQVETTEGGSELLASYVERKEAAGSKMTDYVEELAILNLTKECIEKARQNVMVSTLELLEKRTSEILEMITDDKYDRVRFDKATLKFEVFSKEKNDWVEPHQELSQATVEQIYLTARLALTEILGDSSKPPIILDDSFERFDPSRHDITMKMLKKMAKDRQILLLTSDEGYESYADNLIQL
jgi:uncharacterized protein YhaN